MLRSFRLGEADRVLHLYTRGQGRIGAVAKGIRRTKSRFGGRLEPFSHVEVVLHRGSGELQTVTGASLVASHREIRESPYRLRVGLIGLEAMLRLFPEQDANERAFVAMTRFLAALDGASSRDARPALEPLVLSFQLKLLWVAGYLPHLESCVECGARDGLDRYAPGAGGVVCAACGEGGIALSPAGLRAITTMLRSPIAAAGGGRELEERAARDALAVLSATYEHHAGFRLRTLSA